MSEQVTTRDNAEAGRFEVLVGDEVAGYAVYTVSDGVATMPHTVVEKAFDGQGLGGKLARFSLDTVRSRGLRLDPVCPFIKGYVDKHEEYADLLVG